MSIFERVCAAIGRVTCSNTSVRNKPLSRLSVTLVLAAIITVFVPRIAVANVTYNYVGNPFFANQCEQFVTPGSFVGINGHSNLASCQSGSGIQASLTYSDGIAKFNGVFGGTAQLISWSMSGA